MARAKIWNAIKTWSPTAVGTDETTPLFNVAKGVRVIAAAYNVMGAADAASTMTVTLGDGVDPDGYIAAIDPETATMANGAGAYLATAGGKLYAAADTIDVVYDQTTYAGANIKVQFVVTFEQVFP